MRNPWVHDDMPESAGSGYDGRVQLLGTLVWGCLLVAVAGFLLLSATGTVALGSAETLLTVGTYVAVAVALLLVLPLLFKLLAVSRLLGLAALLATGGLLGRVLWTLESDRLDRLMRGRDALGGASGSVEGLLIELLDVLLTTMRLTAFVSGF